MIKRISAIIFGLITFLTLPVIAFASSGTFTASSVNYNTSTLVVSFHASSFTVGTGTTIHIAGISSCNTTGCGSTDTERYCGDNSTILTDPIDYSCRLNSASNYFPRNGDTVYIEFQAGGNQLYSQAFTLSATSDIFTASGVAYNTSTHLLSFHAASFIGGLGSTSVGSAIHIAGISSCNYYPCGSTNTEFYCGDNSTILTDPIDYSCTLNSNSNYRPNYGDTVYLEFQTPGDQWYSQAFTLTAPNNPPVINQLSNQSINEGATYSASGSFTDTDSTSWTGTVDYGDGGGTQTLTLSGTNFTLNHTYTTAGTFTVTVSVTDNQGATGTGTATVTVNAPPQVNSFSGGTINEGGTYTSNGSFTDSDSTSWTATVDYGDGGGANALTLNSDKTFSLSHVYKDNGTYTVTVSVTNNQGATGTGTATVTTNNVVPTVGTITAPSSPVIVNTSITASANFTDPGVLDTHTASWNWGDGNTTTGTVTESNGSGVPIRSSL